MSLQGLAPIVIESYSLNLTAHLFIRTAGAACERPSRLDLLMFPHIRNVRDTGSLALILVTPSCASQIAVCDSASVACFLLASVLVRVLLVKRHHEHSNA